MRYQENIQNRLTGRHKKCFQFCGDLKGKMVLDIGCSFGCFEKFALEAGCKDIVGIEPDAGNYKRAQVDVPKARFVTASALDLPFVGESFDVVTMFDTLEHLPKGTEGRALQEARRVLRQGGRLIISVPNAKALSNVLDPAWYFGHRHYSYSELAGLIRESGFEVQKVEYGGGFYELLGMILLYIFKWIFRSEILFKSWFDRKREEEYLEKGFVTLFVRTTKL